MGAIRPVAPAKPAPPARRAGKLNTARGEATFQVLQVASLVPLGGVENRGLGTRAIRERREMHVVSGPRPDGPQQRAVDPRDERSVELSRPPEPFPVVVHVAHE